jgi:hypothetical protein
MKDTEFETKARQKVRDASVGSQDAYRKKAGSFKKSMEKAKAFHKWVVSKTK